MKNLPPVVKGKGVELFFSLQLKEHLIKYIDKLSSLDEQTFEIGKLINKMLSTGITQKAVAQQLQAHDRFASHKTKSLEVLVGAWSRGVHHLIKDYGRKGDSFKAVSGVLKEDHDLILSTNIIRNYAGDIAMCMQVDSPQSKSIKDIYENLDRDGKVESMSEMVESVNEEANQKRELRVKKVLRVDAIKAKQPVERRDHYEEKAAQFIDLKTIPSVHMPLYVRFMRALSCCVCTEKKASDTFEIDAGHLPMSSEGSDLLCVPMCVSCKTEHDEGRFKFSQSEKQMMLFKYPSIFLQAMATDVELKLNS